MPRVQQTTTISVDDKVFEVANMSANVQQLVAYLDDWRQAEADAMSQLLMVRGALRDIQNTLLTAIQAEQADDGQKAGDVVNPDTQKTPPAE